MAADCKSAGVRLRRFESFSPHIFAGVVQWQNTSLPSWSREFDSHHPLVHAYVAQSVEHFLGKEEVTGSIPVMSSIWRVKGILGRSKNRRFLAETRFQDNEVINVQRKI